MRRLKFLLCGIVLMLAGCVTDGGKQLNHQNAGAGRFIASTSTQPDVAAAGQDVADNSDALEKEIGSPSEPLAYSHQASVEARRSQEAALAARQSIRDLIDAGLTAATAALGIGGVYFWLKGALKSKMLQAVVKGVEGLAPGIQGEAKKGISEAALEDGVADPMKALVVKLTDPAAK